jgi:predicted Rossmann fold flavoprotein
LIKTIPFAIIGAGPAGLAAAIAYGPGAVIIERNSQAGVKLLLSGSGQCNFTNTLSREDFIRACRKAGPFLKPAFYTFDNEYFISLLSEAGCRSFSRADTKVFPLSLKATDVRDTLLKVALHKGAEIVYNVHVLSITKTSKGFSVETSDGIIRSTKLLLACGGASWPQTGSSGDGYAFAEHLEHTISPIRPALAAVRVAQSKFFRSCAGNSLHDITATFVTGKGVFKDKGDLLFTHQGLSGPLILNNSYLFTSNDIIRLKLVPDAADRIDIIRRNYPNRNILNALKSLPLSEAVLSAVLTYLKIDPTTPLRTLSDRYFNKLSGYFHAADFTVSQVESLATSMSTAGGVLLKEVNSQTMESRLVPGLYLAGEVLDYALPTGGFNIQAAFSTGSLAGISALSQ